MNFSFYNDNTALYLVDFELQQLIPFNDIYFQVNVNGYITFANNIEEYEIDLPYTESILSIFHADYSTEDAGHIYYRQVTSFDFLQQISNDINQYYNTYNAFRAEHVVIVTWENVPLVEDKNKVSYLRVNFDLPLFFRE